MGQALFFAVSKIQPVLRNVCFLKSNYSGKINLLFFFFTSLLHLANIDFYEYINKFLK